MAKTCMRNKEEMRRVKSQNAYAKREQLKEMIKSPHVSYEEKAVAVEKLNKQDRDESPCRVKRRCRSCGRPRAVYRRFQLCRICLRESMVRGDVAGLVKASW